MKKGFTLIETFVAITVLLISLAGPLSIAAQALKSAYYARDEITAFYLAQEGLEFARLFRDQNYLASQPGFTSFSYCTDVSCSVDFPHFTVLVCPPNAIPRPDGVLEDTCPALLIDPTSRLFNTQSGTPSGFTRVLRISPVAGTADEIIVKVRVSWVSAGIPRTFQLSEHLFNWL